VGRRFFSRQIGGALDLAEIAWSTRAMEVTRGPAGTVGAVEERKLKDPEAVEKAVDELAARLVTEGYREDDEPRGAIDAVSFWKEKIEREYLRPGFLPFFGERGGKSAVAASRLGGLPAKASAGWPNCGRCDKPLKFVLQVQSTELAKPPFTGLLQVFLCDSDCYYEDGWEAFSPISHVRLVTGAPAARDEEPEEAEDVADFRAPEYPVSSWDAADIAPDCETLVETFGVDHDAAFDAYDELASEGHGNYADQVGGWPVWIQQPEAPACQKCGAKGMTAVMHSDQALDRLEELSGMRLYVLICKACAALTTVMQR
jgi:hypothetical protein